MASFDRRAFVRGSIGAGIVLASGLAIGEETLKEIGPVSVVASIPQQRVHVDRNGVRVAVSTCSTGKPGHATPGDRLGSHVFVLNGAHDGKRGLHWTAITHHASEPELKIDPASILRIGVDPQFVGEIRSRMHPGMTLIVTDAPLSPDNRSGKDFVIVSTA